MVRVARALALLALLLSPPPAAAVALELRTEVLLVGPAVTLGDLAVVTDGDDALRRRFEQAVVGKAPLVGYVDQRSRADLEMALRGQTLAAGQPIVWGGAERVRLRTESQRLDEEALLDAARRQVQAAHGAAYERLELELAAPLPALLAPTGALTYRARAADAPRLRSRSAVWVDVLVQDVVYRSVVVPLAVRAYRPVYLARRDMAQGDAAGAEVFALELAEVGALTEAPLAQGDLGRHGRLRRALARGQVLTAADVAPQGAVMRGERVRLQLRGGDIALEVDAYAQADAAVGQRVQVRPEHSKETVTAIVVSSDVVRIDGGRQQ